MDNGKQSALNFFTSPAINRMADKRRDAQWLAAQLSNPDTRFVAVRQGRNLFCAKEPGLPLWLDATTLQEFGLSPDTCAFLGLIEGRAYFAVDLTTQDEAIADKLAGRGVFEDLRKAAATMDSRHGSPLAYAKALVHWQQSHGFCGSCGHPTVSADCGHLLVCTNQSCGRQHFPRTDPAIIVIVTREDKCLLGRQAMWPKKMYATIAGFVEPGESLESAVAREVLEETGISLESVTYHSSQPWPFPCSIMLGFQARAATSDIRLDGDELEDARWFTRHQIRDGLANGSLLLPSAVSISYRLIETWFDSKAPNRLAQDNKALMNSQTQRMDK